jgi:hypothetical protein
MTTKVKALIAVGAITAAIGGFLAFALIREDHDCKYGEGPDGECITPRTSQERDFAQIAKLWCRVISKGRKEFVQ